MNPPELPYKTEPFQVNVYKVYLKIIQVLSQKNNQKKPNARNLKERIEELYKIFCKEKGIDDDCNDYNRGRLGLIESTDNFWFTWFSFELVCLESALIYLHLNEHYKSAENKDVFLVTLKRAVSTISKAKLNSFEARLIKIVNWIDSRKSVLKGKTLNDIEDQERYHPDISENIVFDYFNQLSKKGYLSEEQVENLVKANFNFGESKPKNKLKIKIPKSHLNYFVWSFFKKSKFNEKNFALHASKFLITNFEMYVEEESNIIKENNLRKNFRSNPPKGYNLTSL
jgi:hypothetical protein